MRCKTSIRHITIATAAILVGCSVLPGTTPSALISGAVTGAGVSASTKLAVYFGPASVGTPPDDVVPAAAGLFDYSIPSGQDTVTLVPFDDLKNDNTLDAGDPNSLDPNSCADCSYVQAARTGTSWTVSILGGTSGSQAATLTTANMSFNPT